MRTEEGISGSSGGGFVPSGYPYYLDDLWFYNFTTGYWEEKIPGEYMPTNKRF